MWRMPVVVVGAALVAGLTSPAAGAPASAADATLRLTAGSDEVGWISLTVQGPDGAAVDVREQVGATRRPVAGLRLAGGTGQVARAGRWRCSGRARRFAATTTGADGVAHTASAAITTPSCQDRLRMTVVPARLRPGQAAVVHVADGWRLGDVAAKVCASSRSAAERCRQATLQPAVITRRVPVTLPRAGRWTIRLRGASGQRLARHVEVRPDARLRMLVTGDSLTFGLFETLARDLGRRAAVRGDPHPGTGITKPLLDWPRHARQSARSVQPDVTVVLLGSSDDAFPLATPSGDTVPCCGPAWIDAYGRRVSGMMRTYLRDGSGLVYWLKLPAPRRADSVPLFRAENEAMARATAGFDDGVRFITQVADVLSPHGVFHRSVTVRGRRRVVRDDDGVHLAAGGIRLASDVVRAAMRRDGLLR